MSVEGPPQKPPEPPAPPQQPEQPPKPEESVESNLTTSADTAHDAPAENANEAAAHSQNESDQEKIRKTRARLEANKAKTPEAGVEAQKNPEGDHESADKNKKDKDPHTKGHGQGGPHGHEKPHKGHGHEGGHGGHHAPKLSGGEIGGLLASIGIVASAEPIIGTILLNNPVTGPLITGGLAQMGLAASGLAGVLGALGGGLLLFNLIKTAWEKRKDIPGYNLVFGGGGGGGGGAAKKAPAKKAGGGGGGDHGHGGGH